MVNLQDKIGYDIPMDRYEYARTSFSDGDKLNWNVRNNHPTASTYYKVSGTVAYNQYKPADGTSDLTKEQAEALLKQLQAEGYADASIVTFYTTEHEHQQTERNASYRIYLNKSELISYGYLSYDSNTCTNAHNWNQAMYGLSNKYFNPDAYCGGYDLGLTGFRQVEDGTFVAQGKKTITVSRILPATTLTNNIKGNSRRRTSEWTVKGRTSAARPRISNILIMFEPRAVPTAKSRCSCRDAASETMISGNDVPILTTVMPMISGGMPKVRQRIDAAKTRRSAL